METKQDMDQVITQIKEEIQQVKKETEVDMEQIKKDLIEIRQSIRIVEDKLTTFKKQLNDIFKKLAEDSDTWYSTIYSKIQRALSSLFHKQLN